MPALKSGSRPAIQRSKDTKGKEIRWEKRGGLKLEPQIAIGPARYMRV